MPGERPLDVDMTGRTVVVTGASSGIGAAAARRLQDMGADVVPVGRSPEKTRRVADELGVAPEVCDFAELDQVRGLAERLVRRCPRIDVLANNAGGLVGRRTMTRDGNESMLQANHLAHFLLTVLLAERLVASAPSRVVTTSSIGHQLGRVDVDDLDAPKAPWLPVRLWAWRHYGTTKRENVLFTRELQRRLGDRGVTATCFHPGAVASDFGGDDRLATLMYRTPLSRVAAIPPEQGADTLVWLAAAPLQDITPGAYYSDREVARTAAQARDDRVARRLWEESARRVGADLDASVDA